MCPQAMGTKEEKINKWDYVTPRSFCTVEETTNRTKEQFKEWKKIFANDTSNKGLISKTYKDGTRKEQTIQLKDGQKT